MTEYEYNFPSMNEIGDLQIHSFGLLTEPYMKSWPKTDTLIERGEMEKLEPVSTGSSHRAAQEARAAALEAEEEEEEEDDEDEDEDEDEEGEGEGEEEEEEEGDEMEVDEPEPALPVQYMEMAPVDDKFFLHNEGLVDRYNEIEIGGFMKLLDVKPVTQWEDHTTHHYKVGTHAYEDEA